MSLNLPWRWCFWAHWKLRNSAGITAVTISPHPPAASTRICSPITSAPCLCPSPDRAKHSEFCPRRLRIRLPIEPRWPRSALRAQAGPFGANKLSHWRQIYGSHESTGVERYYYIITSSIGYISMTRSFDLMVIIKQEEVKLMLHTLYYNLTYPYLHRLSPTVGGVLLRAWTMLLRPRAKERRRGGRRTGGRTSFLPSPQRPPSPCPSPSPREGSLHPLGSRRAETSPRLLTSPPATKEASMVSEIFAVLPFERRFLPSFGACAHAGWTRSRRTCGRARKSPAF